MESDYLCKNQYYSYCPSSTSVVFNDIGKKPGNGMKKEHKNSFTH